MRQKDVGMACGWFDELPGSMLTIDTGAGILMTPVRSTSVMETKMRHAWKRLCGAGLVCLLSMAGPVFGAEPPGPVKEWFRCEADSDCVHIQYTCAGAAVNRAFAKPADEYFALENARTECVGPDWRERHKGTLPSDRAEVPYKVYCEARQCKVQGISPKKPGFS